MSGAPVLTVPIDIAEAGRLAPPPSRRLASSGPLFLANLIEVAAPFVRNIALARLIAPTEFGLAISLSVVIGVVEVLSDFGLPIFAVRKTSAVPRDVMMATLQSLALVRSAVLALILTMLSPWVAQAFHAPGAAATYALLGPVALLRGFENFGVKELMRRYVFWPEALVLACTQIGSIGVTIAVAAHTGGFACMLWGMAAAALITVVLSHLFSPHPYRLGWDRTAVSEATTFGRPLLYNGAAVSLSLCDRVLVGAVLGPAALAVFNVAYGMATLPRSVLARFLTNALLPLFVEARERGARAATLFDAWAFGLSILAFLYGLGLSLLGDEVLGLVFGAAYRPSRFFMCLAGISMCAKLLMLLPVPAAYATGTTRMIALGSILTGLCILPGAALLVWTRDANLFLLGVAAAEFVALLAFGRRTVREQPFTPAAIWLAIVLPFLFLAALALLAFLAPTLPFGSWLAACAAALGGAAALYGLALMKLGLHPTVLLRRRSRPEGETA